VKKGKSLPTQHQQEILKNLQGADSFLTLPPPSPTSPKEKSFLKKKAVVSGDLLWTIYTSGM